MSPENGSLAFRSLRSRAARVFDETRDVMRQSVLLRFQADSLRRQIRDGQHVAAPHREVEHPPVPLPNRLTPREVMVLKLIVEGRTTREIAGDLGIAFKTAAAHRTSIMNKLDVSNAAGMVREAFRLGIVNE